MFHFFDFIFFFATRLSSVNTLPNVRACQSSSSSSLSSTSRNATTTTTKIISNATLRSTPHAEERIIGGGKATCSLVNKRILNSGRIITRTQLETGRRGTAGGWKDICAAGWIYVMGVRVPMFVWLNGCYAAVPWTKRCLVRCSKIDTPFQHQHFVPLEVIPMGGINSRSSLFRERETDHFISL